MELDPGRISSFVVCSPVTGLVRIVKFETFRKGRILSWGGRIWKLTGASPATAFKKTGVELPKRQERGIRNPIVTFSSASRLSREEGLQPITLMLRFFPATTRAGGGSANGD